MALASPFFVSSFVMVSMEMSMRPHNRSEMTAFA
jgi:hypothetical protein